MSTKETVIACAYGQENMSSTLVKVNAFVVKPPFARTFPSKVLTRLGSLATNASNYPDIHGKMYTDNLVAPENTVLLIQYSYFYRNSPLRNGAVFLSTRDTGPLLEVHAAMSGDRKSMFGQSFVVFRGRADVLELGQLESRGIDVDKSYKSNFMDEEELAESFRIEIIEAAEVAEPPRIVVERDRLGNIIEVKQRPSRKVRLRK